MWEKFKMEIFQSAYYNEYEGFTALDNILYGGAIINAVIGFLQLRYFSPLLVHMIYRRLF